jgi:polysaccharide biosynthesis transport protein
MQATQPAIRSSVVDSEPGYGQLFAALWRRKFWIVSVVIASLGVAYVQTSRHPPTYVSSMQLLVEPNYRGNSRSGQNLESEFSDTDVSVDYATQINLMQSSGLLRRAMAKLNKDYPDLDPDDPGSVAGFQAALSVAQVTSGDKKPIETKIFQISYIDNYPERTQRVLEAVREVYLDYNLEQQRERLQKGLAFVNRQLPQAQSRANELESALEQFRRREGVIDPLNQANTKAGELSRVQQEQLASLTQIRELQTRYTNLRRQVALSPQEAVVASRLSQSGRYQALLNEIQKTELELVQQQLRFKAGTPFIDQLQDKRQDQLGLLRTEVGRILGADASLGGSGLLTQGQLGGLDLNLIQQYVEVQSNLLSAQSRYATLAVASQKLQSELKQYPQLLAEYGRLQPEVELNRDTLKRLLQAQQEIGLEIARGGFDWQVVEQPQIGYKTGPNLTRNLLVGAVAGVMLGGVAAFLREASDQAVRSSEDLKKQSTLPLLGMTPEFTSLPGQSSGLHLPFGKVQEDAIPFAQIAAWKPFRESMDLVYQNLQLMGATSSFKSLVVTSALMGEGTSTTALGLAMSAARLHQRVLLIDANFRNPSLHKRLNLPNERGLSTLLTSSTPIPRQVGSAHGNVRSNISVLTAGAMPNDPAKLLSSQRMREMIATFEQSYDLVLLDVPPVLGMVDAILAASCCSGVVMVGRINQVTRSEFSQALTMLNQLNVVGVIANGANRPSSNSTYPPTAQLAM